MLRSLGETQAREVRFRTMALFPKSGGTRLVSCARPGRELSLLRQDGNCAASGRAHFSRWRRSGSGRKSSFSIPSEAGRPDQDRRGHFHYCRRADQNAGRSLARGKLRPAGLHSPAKSRRHEPAQARQPRPLPEFREVRAERGRRGGGAKSSRRGSNRPVSNSTRSRNAKRISANRSTIFTAFSISSVSFRSFSARSGWRARSRHTCNKKCGRRQCCAVSARPGARRFPFICFRRWRWASPAFSPARPLA